MGRAMSRVHVKAEDGGVHIVIGPKRHFLDLLSVMLLVVFWTFPLTSGFPSADGGLRPRGLALVFVGVAFASVVALMLLATWGVCFQLFGHEDVVLRGDSLSISLIVWRWRYSRRYRATDVRNLRVAERQRRAKGHWVYSRQLCFDYEGTVVCSTRHVSVEEGDLIVGALAGCLAVR